MNEHFIMDYFKNLTFQDFKELDFIVELHIDDQQLSFIYETLKNNLYALLDSHYHQVIINSVKKKTSRATCLQLSYILDHNYFRVLSNV